MNDLTHEFVVSRLEHDIEGLLVAFDFSHDAPHMHFDRVPPIYQQPFSGHYYVVSINNVPVIYSRSLWDQSLATPRLETGERILRLTDGPDNQKLLLLSMGFNKKGKNIAIALAEDLTAIEVQKQRFKKHFFLLSLGGLMLLLLLQSVILRLSFKRLETLRVDINRLEQGKLLKLSDNVPSEVLPLVQEVNHLLTLLEQRLSRSRNALGNLTHALKGPLNLLFQYLDSHQNNVESNNSSNDINAQKQVERINQLINRELKRARLAGKGNSTQRFNADKEVSELISVVKQIYSYRQLKINYLIGETVCAFGDREDMLELMGNLLDNACKWANSKINIAISCPVNDHVNIMIEDDGQGISEHQLASLTKRGERLDESVDGHGLGLSIVNDIVKLYGGTIQFARSSSLGGLHISIIIEF
ncbi:MAG: sensor histidine kinase [Gammaproteobacteria bacterium]|nr:sensor histidine kinase [Gammaproteobacteria bacterium]